MLIQYVICFRNCSGGSEEKWWSWLCFHISPLNKFPNASDSHYLSVFNSSNNRNPKNHIFVVEFNTVNGMAILGDFRSNHVRIDINGIVSKSYIVLKSLDITLLVRNIIVVLSWEQRFKILRDIASALLYLHKDWDQVVIHRDVKASNVLLDKDVNGKLGDFGLARFMLVATILELHK
ncbi:hypothetical protein Syun_029518 [Stephania yunnanensis]|uniref:non-specific serine/threonine protein kinase n=1 Tax=Stephania yunnanensis TaxID=152371 RepID=A0AAP0E5Q9_9MAGN